MKRIKMNRGKDRKVFKKTAVATKKMNLSIGSVPRGGTRL